MKIIPSRIFLNIYPYSQEQHDHVIPAAAANLIFSSAMHETSRFAVFIHTEVFFEHKMTALMAEKRIKNKPYNFGQQTAKKPPVSCCIFVSIMSLQAHVVSI